MIDITKIKAVHVKVAVFVFCMLVIYADKYYFTSLFLPRDVEVEQTEASTIAAVDVGGEEEQANDDATSPSSLSSELSAILGK